MKILKKIILLILVIEFIYITVNFQALVEIISFDICEKRCEVDIENKENRSYLKEIVSDSIKIDKISLKAPIIFNSGMSEGEILKNLNSGVVFYASSDLPNEKGLTVMFGHSSNNWWIKSSYNNIFALIPELEIKDEINIYYQNNKYRYQVSSHEIIKASEWGEIKKPENESGLALITCWPLGTTWKRYIVYADRIN